MGGAERRLAEVRDAHDPAGGAVHHDVALRGVEGRACDHLVEVVHVGRLQVHDVWLCGVGGEGEGVGQGDVGKEREAWGLTG